MLLFPLPWHWLTNFVMCSIARHESSPLLHAFLQLSASITFFSFCWPINLRNMSFFVGVFESNRRDAKEYSCDADWTCLGYCWSPSTSLRSLGILQCHTNEVPCYWKWLEKEISAKRSSWGRSFLTWSWNYVVVSYLEFSYLNHLTLSLQRSDYWVLLSNCHHHHHHHHQYISPLPPSSTSLDDYEYLSPHNLVWRAQLLSFTVPVLKFKLNRT